MPTLHTVNKSPFERDSLKSCISHATKGAAILLFEDGVYGATKGTTAADMVTAATNDVSIYVLGPDVRARGLNEAQILSGVKVVDYDGFVDLVAELVLLLRDQQAGVKHLVAANMDDLVAMRAGALGFGARLELLLAIRAHRLDRIVAVAADALARTLDDRLVPLELVVATIAVDGLRRHEPLGCVRPVRAHRPAPREVNIR